MKLGFAMRRVRQGCSILVVFELLCSTTCMQDQGAENSFFALKTQTAPATMKNMYKTFTIQWPGLALIGMKADQRAENMVLTYRAKDSNFTKNMQCSLLKMEKHTIVSATQNVLNAFERFRLKTRCHLDTTETAAI